MTSLESFSTGSRREKWYFFDSASKYMREMPSPRTLFQPEAQIAPSSRETLLFGMTSSGSTLSCVPRPVHVGHAPNGLLNENMRGVSSSMEMPQSSQA